MTNKIDIIDAAKLYQKLELGNVIQIYSSVIVSIKTYREDTVFKPSEEQSLVIWASIIGAALFPLLNSEAEDKAINQAIEIWPYMFSEKLDKNSELISKAYKQFMHALVTLRMGDDLSLWIRKELKTGENDADFAQKLNDLIAGNKGFWPSVFSQFGVPVQAED